MPEPFPVVLDYNTIQYDGTNSAQIASLITNLEIVSEVDGVLTVESPPDSTVYVINTNDFVVWTQNMIISVHSPSSFAFFYTCNTICATAGTPVPAVRAIGVAPVPTLLAGASITVSVTLQPAMPDATYAAYASKFAGVSVNDLQINSVTIIDADTVDVNVSNVGIATITGATVMVHGVD